MILFDLKCRTGHVFEAWFRNGDAYEAQASAREIACPICGDVEIVKAPMAPRIAKSRSDAGDPAAKHKAEMLRELKDLRRKVEENCDYVGDRFAEEARRIHYGEVEKRGIYGEATEAESSELKEEGITFDRIPWVPSTNS
ncbi:hypothetical protein N825_02630 [Skermanella stibiiresistens SB22]|jgi:hypothetical protein|uniref:Uncharacterized protein n=1 Tax=Skermanella stibiiresistens SB22 TaxID=1385369 RepID=W9HDJ8_9PROT|nr:DUF1178 family protein [Skermanella stibiiresistens]EWY42767.1 hypothetical protein N825_02630 [Skermanella stibiiresistens SB22]